MKGRAMVAAFALAFTVPVSPFLLSAESDAAEEPSAEAEVSASQMRAELSAAGVDVSGMSDTEVALCWGWWTNKNLVGEYVWDDFTGVNWLLDKAGVDETTVMWNTIVNGYEVEECR